MRIALLYFVVSCAWILASDTIVNTLFENQPELLKEVQSIKGLLFVSFCSGLLFLVSRRYYRQLERSLRRSQEMLNRYKALGEATKDGIVDHDLLSDTALINPQMQSFLQTEANVMQHFTIKYKKVIHPDDFQRVNKNFKDTLETRSNVWQADYRVLFSDGTYHDVINRGYIIRDPKNKPLRMISAIQDVTEIRTMKTAIFRQELKHKLKLGQSIIEAQEQERNRWAEELHDNVCQVLTVVKLYLEQAKHEYPGAGMLAKSMEMTEKALMDIRQLSGSIKPPQFSHTTVAESLQELFASLSRVRPYRFHLNYDEYCEKLLKPEQKLMIYRVVQEQLSNIIKYAEATDIRVVLASQEGKVSIEITDNGKGFDPDALTGGIGLKNIRSRLEIYSGNLKIQSAPGKGCRLLAYFSLN